MLKNIKINATSVVIITLFPDSYDNYDSRDFHKWESTHTYILQLLKSFFSLNFEFFLN